MDQGTLSSKSVLETLLKTNRPPTDQEKAIIQESMAPTNEKLKAVEAQISDMMVHIQALKLQAEEAEIKLHRLRAEEAAILATFSDHRRVFAPFRNLPEDVVREICVACVEGEMPKLAYLRSSLPYVLAQICSGMRHIALTTPLIWAAMDVEIRPLIFRDPRDHERAYSLLARRASMWLERAGGLALTISIHDSNAPYDMFEDTDPNPLGIFFDALLSYSTRWKELQCYSHSNHIEGLSMLMIRIAALTAVDVPRLQSISLHIDGLLRLNSDLRDSALLTVPALKHVNLKTYESLHKFAINWSFLTSFTLRGSSHLDRCHPKSEIAGALQQTKCLVFCDINVGFSPSDEHYATEITLPFLKTLIVGESTREAASSGPNILDLMIVPILEIFDIRYTFLDFSLSGFFTRSPYITDLSLPCMKQGHSLTITAKLLRHCPSLTVLSLWPCKIRGPHDANRFLREFVEEGDAGVVCPRLQYFTFTEQIYFSLETLRLFLEGRQRGMSTLKVVPWKRVVFDTIRGDIQPPETCRHILDLVSQKQTAGLDVEIREPQYP